MTVSPPNSSPPTSANQPPSDVERTTLSSNDFLKLLVSELQNQDPTNATSVTDFINQMTSYANFTGQQQVNSSMSSLASSFSSLVTLNSVNYIGHTVEAVANTSILTDGKATFGYTLSSNASDVSITIKDSAGATVWTGSGTSDKGANSFTWDGKDSDGKQLADGGQYTISVTATDATGNSVLSYTSIKGVVTGIDTSTSTPSLTVNGVPVSAAYIIGVMS
jgi:flagellar basal-body rod modification protein FlgD